MRSSRNRCRQNGVRGLKSRLIEEDGSATIEFVLWVPVFVLILGLIFDVSYVFMSQSRMQDAVADASRRWAVGTLTQQEAEAYASSAAIIRGHTPAASGSEANGAVTMTLSIPVTNITTFQVMNFVVSDQLTVSATQLKERI